MTQRERKELIFVTTTVEVDLEDLAIDVGRLDNDEGIIDFVVNVNQCVGETDFTIKLIKRLQDSLSDEVKE